MIFFFTVVTSIVFSLVAYLCNPLKETKKFLAIFLLVIFSSFFLYKKSGNMQSFIFHTQLEKEIQNLIDKPKEFSEIDPKKIIFFLENKLKNNPNDKDGWLLIARTCLLTGHNQKADLYYQKSLKYFPNDEQILYEHSILKKNTNQFESALKILFKIKNLNPLNLETRKLILEILRQTNQLDKLDNEIAQIKKNENISDGWLKKTILDLHLKNL